MQKQEIEQAAFMDETAAIRNARTMVTSAECKGRQDSYIRAQNDGIVMQRRWIATKDARTRHWHAELDGALAEVDEPFENAIGKIMYPGDPSADGANVYNCRCTIAAKVLGFKKVSGNVSANPLTPSRGSGIIDAEALSRYVNSSDKLHEYSKKIEPLPGYEDVVIHGDRNGFELRDLDGNTVSVYTPREFAEILREDPNYHGGKIRLISCETGAGETCAAQLLSNELGVDVLAPSDIVFVDSTGNMQIGIHNDGEWILFTPKEREK